MTQNIEEQKEVSVQEASTLAAIMGVCTAAESESQVITINTNRTHEEYDEYTKLKLIRAVDIGLSVGCAANMV